MSDWVIFAGMLLGAFVVMFLVSTILDHRRKMAEINAAPYKQSQPLYGSLKRRQALTGHKS